MSPRGIPSLTVAPDETARPQWRDRVWWRLAAPYIRAELPAWGRIYTLLGGDDDARWRGAPTVDVTGKLHGYRMRLDLSNWSERLSHALTRYHDLPIQLLLLRVLRDGDCFVDIGANLGHMSLLARSCVGDHGRVLACEPNPVLVRRLQACFAANALANVEVVATAVGEVAGVAELREYAHHSGWGSLSASGPEGAAATGHWTVPLAAGDDLFARVPAGQPAVVKVDVEGHEVPVLKGLRRTLAERLPLVLLEVADAHQRRAGYSAAQLRAPLEELGYIGYEMTTRRRGLWGHELSLRDVGKQPGKEIDAVFVPPRGPLHERLQPLLPASARRA
jgi:FkbM family methyltransferase